MTGRRPRPAAASDAAWWPASQIRGGIVAAALLVLGFGGWAATVPLAGAIQAPGVVSATGSNHAIRHPDGGWVAAIHQAEGAHVAAGAPLVTLDLASAEAERAAVVRRLLELDARQLLLSALRDGADLPAFPADLTEQAAAIPGGAGLLADLRAEAETTRAAALREAGQLEIRRARLDAQAAETRAIHAALLREEAVLLAELADLRRLVTAGAAPAQRTNPFEREAARLSAQLAQTAAMLAELDGLARETAIAADTARAAPAEWAAAELGRIAPERAELAARLTILDGRIGRGVLRAPVAGWLHDLRPAGSGALIGPGEIVASVVPENAGRVIEARLRPADRSLVAEGAAARIRIAPAGAPPVEVPARIVLIGADSTRPETDGAPFYRLRAAVAPADVDPILLTPGQPVDVLIPTTRRTLMATLLAPLAEAARRSLASP